MKYFLPVILLPLLQLFNQVQAQVKPLTIGDSLPGSIVSNMLNTPASQSSLAAFKGKWLILDFMATTCHGCIMSLPRLNAIQRSFARELNIVLVSYENPQKVKSFLQKNPVAAGMPMIVIAADTLLAALFPHLYLPHEVWIDPSGIVRAITTQQYVNAANVATAVNGKPLTWLIKNDFVEYDIDKPLLQLNTANGNVASFTSPLGYSALLSSIPSVGLHYKVRLDSVKRTITFSMINMSAIELYLYAYGRQEFPACRIVLVVKDTARYVYDESKAFYDEWQLHNTWCFESVSPLGVNDTALRENILSALDRSLGISGRMEKKEVDCLVLRDTAQKDLHRYIPYPPDNKYISTTNLVYILDNQYFSLPVIDERTNRQEYNLPLEDSLLTNLPTLKKAISKFGYALQPARRKLEMLVIIEKK